MREDLDDEDCLTAAAAVLAARQQVDPLLLRLAVQPFDGDAIDDLRRWIDEIYPLAAPAWVRLLGLPGPDCPDATEIASSTQRAGLHLAMAPAAANSDPITPRTAQ